MTVIATSSKRKRSYGLETTKSFYLPNETVLSKSVSWEPRETSEEQAGMSNLSYKREKKSGDCNKQTHKRSDKVL